MLYEILLNPEVQDRIKLSDAEIKDFASITTTSLEKEISPFEINRIFLQAIIVKPCDWSEVFFHAFSTVLKFVDQNFNNNTHSLAVSLKHDSFPADLLNQLDYLKDQIYLSLLRGV